MPVNLDVSRSNNIAVVRCRGRIVFGDEADELRRVILGLLKETEGIVLDFAWVEYIDSSGVGVLVASLISAPTVELRSSLLPWGTEFDTF